MLNQPFVPAQDKLTVDSDTSDEELESENSDNDLVFGDTADMCMESSTDDMESDESDNDMMMTKMLKKSLAKPGVAGLLPTGKQANMQVQ